MNYFKIQTYYQQLSSNDLALVHDKELEKLLRSHFIVEKTVGLLMKTILKL